jgi:beta-glucosidase
MSYTRFKFGKPVLEKSTIRPDETTSVLVDITNTGTRAGDEVVQLYIRDRVSSVTRPVKELKGFRRIRLEPGESRNLSLEITPESLAFHNVGMEYLVEPGEFEIMVGSSSRNTDLQTVLLNVRS